MSLYISLEHVFTSNEAYSHSIGYCQLINVIMIEKRQNEYIEQQVSTKLQINGLMVIAASFLFYSKSLV